MRLRFADKMDHLRRYRHILAVLMKYGFDEVVDALRRRLTLRLGAGAVPTRVRRAADGRSRPQRVRLALAELGPTFIKLGQLLSTRPDMVPPEYVAELELLQDRVAPADYAAIRKAVEAELKKPLEALFLHFEEQPLAAASIAQVHRAVLPDGTPVVVKVRRPGIVHAIRVESEILLDLAALIKSSLSPQETIDPVRMVQEFTTAVNKEVHLSNEARNQRRFARDFADDPTVRIPKLYGEYSTDGVLTMEYIAGIKCSDMAALEAAGLDRKLIAARGANFILRQLFDFGFFHTDPHPGNLFILPDNVLAPVDFGQAARLSGENRRLMSEMVLSVSEVDAQRMVHAVLRSELVSDTTNVEALAGDLEDMLQGYADLPLREIPVGRAIAQGFEIMRRHRVRPPAEFTLMLKSLMTIESIAKALDANFQLMEHLRPYARRLSLERMDPRRLLRQGRQFLRETAELALAMPQQLSAILNRLRRGHIDLHVQHEHLENLVHTLDRASNRIAFGLIIAGSVVASSLLVTQGSQRVLLGVVRVETLGIFGYLIAALLGLWLLVSILRSRRL
jgi:ubiquinone biosynthesis protein